MSDVSYYAELFILSDLCNHIIYAEESNSRICHEICPSVILQHHLQKIQNFQRRVGRNQENCLEIWNFQLFYVLLPTIIAIHDAKARNKTISN